MKICSKRTDRSVDFEYKIQSTPCRDRESGEEGICTYLDNSSGYIWDLEIESIVEFGRGPTTKTVMLLYCLFRDSLIEPH